MTDRPIIVMLTETYPYPGPDDPFLESEVAALAEHATVLLVPTVEAGDVRSCVPGSPLVDTSLAESLQRMSRVPQVGGLLSRGGFREIGRHGGRALRPRALATVARRQSRARVAEAWTRSHLLPNLQGRRAVVYSWWGTAAAAGVGRALAGSRVPYVCRMHGYDLYAEQERVGFVPLQASILQTATEVWTAARAGADYLHNRYPEARAPIVVRPVGSEDAGLAHGQHQAPSKQVVSCSAVHLVKRVDLLARALSDLALRHPDLDFHWTHIGGGTLLGDVQSLTRGLQGLPGRATFLGELSHDDVLRWLSGHQVDAFCNVSSSEGLPVTLMEAASAGIPLLALNVGGNAEIVNETNGRLLPADAGPSQISAALAELLTAPRDEIDAMRLASRTRWEERFDARQNHSEVARRLTELATTPMGPTP